MSEKQKVALITGVTGQDGAYLAELLLKKGYIVHGLKRRASMFNTARIEALEVENLIECAQATMVSAAARQECRGAHTVSDYEKQADDPVAPLGRDDANWMKHTLWHSSTNSLTYKPVQLKPMSVESVPPKVRTF